LSSAAANVASGLGPAAGVAIALALGFPTLFAISAGIAVAAVVLCALIREPERARTGAGSRSLRGAFHGRVVRPGLVLLALQLTYGAVVSFIPLLALERGLGNPGLFFTAFALASVGSQTVSGQVSDRFGRRAAIVPGLVLVGAGLLAMSALGGWSMLIAAAIYGAGFGATQPSLFALGGDFAGPGERGSAMATLGLFLELGISAGSIAAGLVAGPIGLSATFVAFSGVALAGVLLALAMPEAPSRG
jgi:MFS family permease